MEKLQKIKRDKPKPDEPEFVIEPLTIIEVKINDLIDFQHWFMDWYGRLAYDNQGIIHIPEACITDPRIDLIKLEARVAELEGKNDKCVTWCNCYCHRSEEGLCVEGCPCLCHSISDKKPKQSEPKPCSYTITGCPYAHCETHKPTQECSCAKSHKGIEYGFTCECECHKPTEECGCICHNGSKDSMKCLNNNCCDSNKKVEHICNCELCKVGK